MQQTSGKPSLGSIGKSNSVDGKISRTSLTRGSSQDDPQQLMRDLQDSIEREADIREQLKFAEEEAESLRKKVLRIEDENESLMVQLKKMATKARSKCEIETLQIFRERNKQKKMCDDVFCLNTFVSNSLSTFFSCSHAKIKCIFN